MSYSKKLAQRRVELLAKSAALREQVFAFQKPSLWNILGFKREHDSRMAVSTRNTMHWLPGVPGFIVKFYENHRVLSWISLFFGIRRIWKYLAAPLLSIVKKIFFPRKRRKK